MDVTPFEPLEQQPPFVSTPLSHVTRKRKLTHDDTTEFTHSPKFSSTLNESLITELSDIRLASSVHNTPEKRFGAAVVSSPIQESRKILYSSIKVVKPGRKFGLLKSRNVLRNSFDRILNTHVIMDVIFEKLSGGDLYRFGQVSTSFYRALERNRDAFTRYQIFKCNFKDNKENYVITPPGSPEKADSPPRTTCERLNTIMRFSKSLNNLQTLGKCHRCHDVAVVENQIGQCQNTSCGLIWCLLCWSTSKTGPKDFVDHCGHASLRPKLGNVSNHSSFLFSSQDSGFYSENESPPKVRRNLFSTRTDGQKPLTVSNRNKSQAVAFPKRRLSCVPVVLNEVREKEADCDSPPRRGYAAGSKQSKKNLKRLTR